MIVKFIVPPGDRRAIPEIPGCDVEGVIAVVQAATVIEARALLDSFCEACNQPKWASVASVEILNDIPQVFAYVA